MPYAAQTITRVSKAPRTLGNRLGRVAVQKQFSVTRISGATGATRQTVYNWLFGGEILSPYQPVVERLLRVLEEAKSADHAWRKVCAEFNVKS
jgi:hypothetical protein